MTEIAQTHPPLGTPALSVPNYDLLRRALRLGWRDFMCAPWFGLLFASVYVLFGWGISAVTLSTGHSFWLVLAVISFPLIGPFAATGLYEVSRRLETGEGLGTADILGVVWRQRGRQLPWLCVIIVILFLFWFFVGHMIFALFLGLSQMTNINSSLDVYLSANGLQMLGFGTVIGAGFALLLYSLSVIALPLLLDREVDFVTAMITSVGLVQRHPVVMLSWAVLLAGLTFLAMIPAFLGLFLVLPWLGHASWHVYSQLRA